MTQSAALAGKVAVITGAGSGIGKALAEAYAAAGCKVAVADINQQAADQTLQAIKKQGGQALSITLDVTDEASVDTAITTILNTWHQIDILINNAGSQHITPIDKLEFSAWKKLLAIQLDGAFLMTRACLQAMYQNEKGGCIIYMGSIQSKEGPANKAPYVVAKHGLAGLCKVVAREGAAHNVRAYLLCPAYVWTPLVQKQIPHLMQTQNLTEQEVINKIFLDGTVDQRFTTFEEITQTALFLTNDTSGALTGQPFILGHGRCML